MHCRDMAQGNSRIYISYTMRVDQHLAGVKGRRYKLCWSGNSDGMGDVGVLVKEQLCEKVVEM